MVGLSLWHVLFIALLVCCVNVTMVNIQSSISVSSSQLKLIHYVVHHNAVIIWFGQLLQVKHVYLVKPLTLSMFLNQEGVKTMSDNHTISMFFVLVIVEVLCHPLFRCQANSCS